MRRRTLMTLLAISATPPGWTQTDGGVWLVSPDEALRYEGGLGFERQDRPMTRSLALPAIELVEPVLESGRVKSPFPIKLQFRPADAPIVPSSFRILYGALGFDITSRVARYANVTAEGLSLDHAQVPPGKHKLLLQVADERQRVAEKEFRVEVV